MRKSIVFLFFLVHFPVFAGQTFTSSQLKVVESHSELPFAETFREIPFGTITSVIFHSQDPNRADNESRLLIITENGGKEGNCKIIGEKNELLKLSELLLKTKLHLTCYGALSKNSKKDSFTETSKYSFAALID